MAATRKRQELAAQQERLREAYNELKYTAPDKVAAMRDQEMTRLQMNLAYRTGEELLRTDCERIKECRQSRVVAACCRLISLICAYR